MKNIVTKGIAIIRATIALTLWVVAYYGIYTPTAIILIFACEVAKGLSPECFDELPTMDVTDVITDPWKKHDK